MWLMLLPCSGPQWAVALGQRTHVTNGHVFGYMCIACVRSCYDVWGVSWWSYADACILYSPLENRGCHS